MPARRDGIFHVLESWHAHIEGLFVRADDQAFGLEARYQPAENPVRVAMAIANENVIPIRRRLSPSRLLSQHHICPSHMAPEPTPSRFGPLARSALQHATRNSGCQASRRRSCDLTP